MVQITQDKHGGKVGVKVDEPSGRRIRKEF